MKTQERFTHTQARARGCSSGVLMSNGIPGALRTRRKKVSRNYIACGNDKAVIRGPTNI
jgi:hypothetical protein